jgi:hypothetical protein
MCSQSRRVAGKQKVVQSCVFAKSASVRKVGHAAGKQKAVHMRAGKTEGRVESHVRKIGKRLL